MNISLECFVYTEKFMNAMAFDLLTARNDQKWIHQRAKYQTGSRQGWTLKLMTAILRRTNSVL